MLKIRRSWDRLIFNMGIPILVRRYLYIETDPCFWHQSAQIYTRFVKFLFHIIGSLWIHVLHLNNDILQRFHVMTSSCSESTHTGQQVNHQSNSLPVLCKGNPSVTDGFPSQRASNVGSVSMSWRHHTRNHSHWVDVKAPGSVDVPAGHVRHNIWPSCDWYVPAAQSTHAPLSTS